MVNKFILNLNQRFKRIQTLGALQGLRLVIRCPALLSADAEILDGWADLGI